MLLDLYSRTGAQYFMALANHHDNLDLYQSTYQEWNSTKVGPKKDIIGVWAKAAKKRGLRFGVSVHAAHAWTWYETAQRSDKEGPKKGIPYDGKLRKADGVGTWWEGMDPQALYAQDHKLSKGSEDDDHMIHRQWHWETDTGASVPTPEYCENFYNRTVELIDNYEPDVVYFDDTAMWEFLVQELHAIYKTVLAKDGEEGLLIAVAQQPDLILSDIKMPRMDGFELVRRLKSNSNTSHIPIILLTSKTAFEDRIAGLEKGADAYLNKPFSIKELLITVSNLILSRRTLKGKFSGAQAQEARVKPMEFRSSDEMLMERIMTVINEEIGNPELNVEMLVSKVGLSRVQLHRKLKEITGISTGDFIRNIRLNQAATLLGQKKMNIAQVAYAVGFVSQAHFSTVFKKCYGLSPSEYIAQFQDVDLN